jgi:tetratricopeptide (TPR) repeat protein
MNRAAALLVLCAAAAAALHAAPPEPSLDTAFDRLYNFDFPATHQVLDQYIEMHPHEALPYAVRAAGYLFFELNRLGILESEFLIDDRRIAKKGPPLQPDPAVRAKLVKALDDTQQRATAALAHDPNDREALLAMVIAQGVTVDYMAFIEKHQFRSLSPAEQSNSYAQRLLRLDPHFYDAYLTAGLSEYMVGSLPFFIRWFVHFDNVDGDKAKGVRCLETVAREGHYLKAFGQILLGIIDLREKRPHDAQKLLVELNRNYPANPLFKTELAKLNAKLGM